MDEEALNNARMQPLIAALGEETMRAVTAARVCLIGAGGIGCEVLKNLVMTGFTDIEVIDLDTIDVSNLNRQFLFRSHHVGRPKAAVAVEVAKVFNPRVKLVAHHADVKTAAFGVSFLSRFNVVINALDNISARRHVNRACLAADVPLIEAGTQGYLGQAFAIKRGVTECFDCQPKPTPKKFPICTIRSTPDKPVHCVVWAKEFHRLLFGDSTTSYLYEAVTGAVEEGASSAPRDSVYMSLVESAPAPGADEPAVRAWARRLVDAMFHDEIVKRLEMAPETYKTMKAPPVALKLADIESGRIQSPPQSQSAGGAKLKDQIVLSLRDSAALMVDSIVAMYTDAATAAAIGSLEFSKDSPADVDFVTAATNLRAFTFGIPMQSRWDVKSIAGNIIPAIATTNAIVAGMEVLEAIKILRGDDIGVTGSYTNVLRKPAGKGQWLLMAATIANPNPKCYVCGSQGVTIILDTTRTTLRDFISKILKGNLGFNLPNIDNGVSFNYLEEREDGESDEAYARKLAMLDVALTRLVGGGLQDGSILQIEDFSQDLCVQATLVHRDTEAFDELKHPQFFEVVVDDAVAQLQAKLDAELASAKQGSAAAEAAPEPTPAPAAGMKRRRDDDIEEIEPETAPKRERAAESEVQANGSAIADDDVVDLS